MREQRFSGWAMTTVLLVGLLLAPVGARAAGSLMEISSPSGRRAHVSEANQLYSAETSPEKFRRGYGYVASVGGQSGCQPVIRPPADKAMVVKTAIINVKSLNSPTESTWIALSANSTCTSSVMSLRPDFFGAFEYSFGPGVAIPAGGGLYARSQGEVAAYVYAFGYVVPDGAVAASQ
jgi:hypothetical protein